MTAKLHRTFPSRERFLSEAVRRLSDREAELDLPGRQALPTGSLIDLDLRLDDGSPLLVGTGMITRGVGDGVEAPFRVRFLGLTDPSRTALDELVAEAARAQADVTGPARPSETSEGGRRPESLEDLVAGAFGSREVPATDPAPAVGPPLVELPDPEELKEDEAPRKRSLWERLQVSPAVIVASLIAGLTGAAADHWFEEVGAFVGELRAADTQIAEAPVIDIPPANVRPSDFSAEGGEAEGAGRATAVPMPSPEPASARSVPPGPAAGAFGGEPSGETPTAAEAGGAPADRVRLITWDARQSETVVTFWGNGPFLPERVVRFRVEGGTPRELLKLRGIDLPLHQTGIEVGTPELVRIRTGFHPQDRVNELHVVLDLAAPGVELSRTEGTANSLSVHLRSANGE